MNFSWVGGFRISGKIVTQCSMSDPLSGELTVEASAVPINSIDIHILRIESILVGEKIVSESSVIQTTQAWMLISSFGFLFMISFHIFSSFLNKCNIMSLYLPDSRWRCLSQHGIANLCYPSSSFDVSNCRSWVSRKWPPWSAFVVRSAVELDNILHITALGSASCYFICELASPYKYNLHVIIVVNTMTTRSSEQGGPVTLKPSLFTDWKGREWVMTCKEVAVTP